MAATQVASPVALETATATAPQEQAVCRLSVVTPTYNRVSALRKLLLALAQQTVDPGAFEVLVISDGSTDGTDECCRTLDAPYTLRYFEQDHLGPAAARNLGVREARGDIILFLDDDIVPDTGLVAAHLRVHEQDPTAVAMGTMLPPRDVCLQPWVDWEEEQLLQQYSAMLRGTWKPTPRQFYTGNASVARAAVLAAGAFDEHFKRAEDIELAYRMGDQGATFYFLPEAQGWHYAQRSFKSWLTIPNAYGHADVLMARQGGRPSILVAAGEEFHYRHAVVRALGRFAVGRPKRYTAIIALCSAAAHTLTMFATDLGYAAASYFFSIIFNLSYWQGICEDLGPEAFWALIAEHAPRPKPAPAPAQPRVEPASLEQPPARS